MIRYLRQLSKSAERRIVLAITRWMYEVHRAERFGDKVYCMHCSIASRLVEWPCEHIVRQTEIAARVTDSETASA